MLTQPFAWALHSLAVRVHACNAKHPVGGAPVRGCRGNVKSTAPMAHDECSV